jgi:hypothetical protein
MGATGWQAMYEALDRVGRECLTALERGLAVGRPGAFTEVLDHPARASSATTTARVAAAAAAAGGGAGGGGAAAGGLHHVPEGSQTTLRLLHYDRVHTVATATAQVRLVCRAASGFSACLRVQLFLVE